MFGCVSSEILLDYIVRYNVEFRMGGFTSHIPENSISLLSESFSHSTSHQHSKDNVSNTDRSEIFVGSRPQNVRNRNVLLRRCRVSIFVISSGFCMRFYRGYHEKREEFSKFLEDSIFRGVIVCDDGLFQLVFFSSFLSHQKKPEWVGCRMRGYHDRISIEHE